MLKLYNTLFRKKQIFKPLKDRIVRMYTCGPTVYDFAHLGNLRTYIFEDVLRRVLEYNGYQVKQVMNITDVDDKIINRMKKENKTLKEVTLPFTKKFFLDLKKLNIKKAEFYPKATSHIKEMIALIAKLIRRKFAYQGNDGSIYFNISKFKNYGKLSQLQKRKIKIGARIAADEYSKEQAQDFVLWKNDRSGLTQINKNLEADKRGIEPFWQSPWGAGRPGWHIECSAMSIKYLGQPLDIHAGGVDLIFPHHENEIAQSEAATGKKFVRFWLHSEHLLINGQKMSKSLGNIYTLSDLEKRKFNPLAFRYLVLTSHYRSKLNFTWQSLEAAQKALNNLTRTYADLTQTYADSETNASRRHGAGQHKSAYKRNFLEVINDDLDTPKALAIVWQVIRDNKLSHSTKRQLLLEFDKVLGLGLDKIKPLKIPLKIKKLVAQREKLRINKQFIQADRLRKKIEKLGYKVEDTRNGPIIRKG